MEDNRILWLKCTIANMLGVYEPEYVNAAIYENLYDFKSFLNDKYTKNEDINKMILYVWRTFYDKLVEEEITVLEEGKSRKCIVDLKKARKKLCNLRYFSTCFLTYVVSVGSYISTKIYILLRWVFCICKGY